MPKQSDTMTEKYNFGTWMTAHDLSLHPVGIETLWLNITRLCNQACHHCHLSASPEMPLHMSKAVMDACLSVIASNAAIRSVDITGGAPELHPGFEALVGAIRHLDKKVTVRHNLTVTLDGHPLTGESRTYLPEFFAANRVELLASMPAWEKDAADQIRGRGVFEKSLKSLRQLNAVGYGSRPELILKLVTNHDGPLSATKRVLLESRFHEVLGEYGIKFNDLLTVTNIPAGRYATDLQRTGGYDEYMNGLIQASDETAIKAATCRTLVSVGPDGRLYDCDFNLALDRGLNPDTSQTIFEFDYDRLINRTINFAGHCFACSAGAGSG
ncbi:MAG: arsenosugar biosynthesis radical SAM protein ArsS [Dehalogenimonas sp.]|jgi:radical SAM/Cys-rich protein|uniref:Arsenosugar biosynthesis radical SAM (Seleno)protein ArsS n=1 Tax=Candidatus Dehalogenimonas loeffleri TaxID=3127115 RepID=A0ABZ2J5J0_9CHLR|nr:arsenosugar biosynthesis radical SAM protein ArsS [Dehalogenimonas sp.]